MSFKGESFYSRKCKSHTLIYDQACLDIVTEKNVSFWIRYTKCMDCDYTNSLVTNKTDSVILKTLWPVEYFIEDDSSTVICNETFSFGEYGKYRLNVTNKSCSHIEKIEDPDEPYFPLLVGIVVTLCVATIWYFIKLANRKMRQWALWNRIFMRNEGTELLIGSPIDPPGIRKPNTRVHSVDTFRGIIIALMILVNYGGGGYKFLNHSPWNGLTIADVVFPCFAWLMGFSMCISLHTKLRTSMTRKTALIQIIRRSLILIILGVILSSKDNIIENLRFPGVLQRLGLSYLIVATLECCFITTSRDYLPGTALFRDLKYTWVQWSGTIIMVAVQVCLTFLLPVPGCPLGYLGPGGLHNHSFAKNCTGGSAAYIDTLVFENSHLYKRGSFRSLYKSTSLFDPEGLLGTLTCALIIQFGIQAARILFAYSHARARVIRWILWSICTGVISGILCNFSENNGYIPINKNLWSLSFSLATSSIAFFTLAFLYTIIDIYSIWQGRPFYYAGRNALLLYIGHLLMKGRFPFEWKLEYPSHMELLSMNIIAVGLWLGIASMLHRKNVILTV